MSEIRIIKEQEVLGKDFKVYGDFENPLFLAKDVAEWIEHSNPRVMLESIDDDEKVVNNVYTLGGNQNAWFLTENGLYEVLMLSRKPIAKEFKKQVKVILKDIRKHGVYATDKVIEDIVNNPDLGIELFTRLKEERAARLKAEQTNAVLMHVKKTYTASEIAKELGMRSAIELNKWLEEKGIQFKVNNTWLPKAEYADRGFFDIKQDVLDNGHVIYHRRITQLGREFILGLAGVAA